jgi:hypothetical protein
MDIDTIIRESLQQILSEYQARRSSFLNIIHHNIDILVKNANVWFKDDVPQEYTDVLNSLINLTIIFFDQDRDSLLFSESDRQIFSPGDTAREVADDIRFLLNKSVSVDSLKDLKIETSRKILKESLMHIILCIVQFAESDPDFSIRIDMIKTNVRISLSGKVVPESVPDIPKLTRMFYSYYLDQKYHFRIGLEIPFSNIRRIGGIPSLSIKNGMSEIYVSITFPTYEFLQTVDDIRRQNPSLKKTASKGTVLMSVSDTIMQMVIRENLSDSGYNVKMVNPSRLSFERMHAKALIIDRDTYNLMFSEYDSSSDRFQRVIVVCNSDDTVQSEGRISSISMPFEVQDIINLIEWR